MFRRRVNIITQDTRLKFSSNTAATATPKVFPVTRIALPCPPLDYRRPRHQRSARFSVGALARTTVPRSPRFSSLSRLAIRYVINVARTTVLRSPRFASLFRLAIRYVINVARKPVSGLQGLRLSPAWLYVMLKRGP